jgi:hypothetical protein
MQPVWKEACVNFAEAADVRLILYLKDETNMGADRMAQAHQPTSSNTIPSI